MYVVRRSDIEYLKLSIKHVQVRFSGEKGTDWGGVFAVPVQTMEDLFLLYVDGSDTQRHSQDRIHGQIRSESQPSSPTALKISL